MTLPERPFTKSAGMTAAPMTNTQTPWGANPYSFTGVAQQMAQGQNPQFNGTGMQRPPVQPQGQGMPFMMNSFSGLNGGGMDRTQALMQQLMMQRQQQPQQMQRPEPQAQPTYQQQPQQMPVQAAPTGIDPAMQKNYIEMAREFFRKQENPGYGQAKAGSWMSDPTLQYFVNAGREMLSSEKSADKTKSRLSNYILGGQ